MMSKLSNFIIRERLYVLMLLFIVLFNVANASSKNERREQRKAKLTALAERLKAEAAPRENELKAKLEKRPMLAFLVSAFSIAAFAGFAFGIFSFFNVIFKMARKEEILPRRAAYEERGWPPLDIVRLSITIYFIAYIAAISFAVIFGLLKLKTVDEHMSVLLDTTIIDVVAIACVYRLIRIKYRDSIASLGLTLRHWAKDIATGVAGYLTLLPSLVAMLLLVIWISGLFKYEAPPQPVIDLFISEKRSAILLYGGIFVALLGPVAEEVFFRGFAYTALRNRLSMKPALIITSAAFGALHGNIVAFLPVASLGCLLAYLYEKTGSLIPSITVHIIHNSALIFVVFIYKELIT